MCRRALPQAVDKIVVGTSGHFADVVASLADMLERNKTAEQAEQWGPRHKFEFVDHNREHKYLHLGGSHIAREVPPPSRASIPPPSPV